MKTKSQAMYEVTAYSKEQRGIIRDFYDRGILPAGVTDANKLLGTGSTRYYVAAAGINEAIRLFEAHYTQYDIRLVSIQFASYVLAEE